jgi:phosphate transport system substrate-binding protein
MRRLMTARIAGLGMAAALVLGIAGAPLPASAAVGTEYYPVSGGGSTWSANALDQWIRNVWNNYRWKIEYNGTAGSSAGRQVFAQENGGYDFAVSEIPYQLKDSDSVDPRPSRRFAYMPIVAGGTSFMYNLVIGGKKVTNLRLGGETVAKIFTGAITKWDDPAIKADNPQLALPAIPIVPVVRSDGSGTSAQFSSWMRKQYPSVWSAFCTRAGRAANCGITSNYPAISGFKGQSGSNGVAGYVAQPQYVGSITYVEYSYALNSHSPVAKVLNSAGYYVEPTAANVAVALLGARINEDEGSPDYLTQQLDGVYTNADPRAYPLSSYSYMLIPTALEYGFTENKGLTLAAFAKYFLCEGQQQADVLGYSPLPINLAQAGLDQVKKIPGGDPASVDIRNCNNPTFSPDGGNKLAQSAPQPQACDKKGPTQCATGTGGLKDQPTQASGGGGASGGDGDGEVGGDEGGGGEASGGGIDSLGGGGPVTVAGSPTTLPVSSTGAPGTIAAVAAALIVAVLIFGPPVMSRRRRKSRAPRSSSRAGVRRLRLPRIHLPSMRRTRAAESTPTEVS